MPNLKQKRAYFFKKLCYSVDIMSNKELELVKKSLMVWLGGMIISAFILFSAYVSWLVLYMDNKNRDHAEARFDQMSSQVVQMDKHF